MTTEERFTRIETILEHAVDRQESLDHALTNLAEAQTQLTQAQAKSETQIATLAATVRALADQVANTERQWQAYINRLPSQ